MHRECDGRSERGVVLVITMMALLVLVGLTGALIPLTSTETSIVANHCRAVQILYAADAALEWVIQDLQREPSWTACSQGLVDRPCVLAVPSIGSRTKRC